MKRLFWLLLGSMVGAGLLACGGGADKGGASSVQGVAVLQSISVAPAGVSLAVGGTQAFVATGLYSDGSSSPLLNGVVWGSSSASVLVNTGMGLTTAVSAGTATVTASAGGVAGTASVVVTPITVTGAAYRSVAAGHFHTLGVRSDGALYAWGQNQHGQLGDATLVDKSVPVRIGTDVNWTQVSAGEYHSLALKTDGTLWAWGLNIDGQLGHAVGDATRRTVPVQVGTDKDWLAVAAGKNHSLALKSDFSLWAWGRNATGQLGVAVGDISNRYVPTAVGADKDWMSIAAGADHSLALKNTNALWAWGLNANGQLGDNTVVRKEVPTAVDATQSPNTQWVAVAAGGAHTLAVRNDGALFVWGSNAQSQLGNGAAGPVLIPTRLGNDTDWQWVAAGGAHSVAKRRDGSLWTWGSGAQGQLGNGALAVAATPARVDSAKDWAMPFAGWDNSFGLRNNQQLWGWGRNTEGQQGNGNWFNVMAPTAVP